MKKIFLGLGALALAVALVPMFAAFEAHVINVTAQIENALSVPASQITFGTTFPEEVINKPLGIALSGSFMNESGVDDVEYVIRQKPKCGLPIPNATTTQYSAFEQVAEDAQGNYICPDAGQGYKILPLLCPFLSKHPDGVNDQNATSTNDGSLDAFHGPLSGWTASTTLAYQVLGRLAKSQFDTTDNWTIDLHTPCFKGSCSQDNVIAPEYQEDPALEHQLFGCDLWVEVTGISQAR